MAEHVDGPGCKCWGCVSRAAHDAGVCVVHAVYREHIGVVSAAVDSRICSECEEKLWLALRMVDDRWDDAQDSLAPGRGGGSERKTPREEPPVPLRVEVVDAMRDAGQAIWKLAFAVTDRYIDVRLPDDQSTPSLAGWLARSMVPRIVQVPDPVWVLKAYWWAIEAGSKIEKVTEGGETEVVLPDLCKIVVMSEDGKPVVCGGEVKAVWQHMPKERKVVQCTRNRDHFIPFDVWQKQQAARKPRGARPRNHAGI